MNNIKLSLVFCNTKKRVDELASNLQSRGYMVEALHGDMRQEKRDKVMSKFRKGHIDILIATDVAARGIDVDNIEAVFNYDMPNDDEYYVHRIGRTGRAGKTGKSFTFVSRRKMYKLKDIQKYTKSTMKLIKPPTSTDIKEQKISKLLNTIKETIKEDKYSQYISYVERIISDINSQSDEDNYITTLDISAAMLKMIFNDNSNNDGKASDFDQEHTERDNDTVTLFINIGRNAKVQVKDIIDLIASNTGVPRRLIGSIKIFDKYTFAEVPAEYSSELSSSSKNYTFKGKKITIQKSNAKLKSKRRA